MAKKSQKAPAKINFAAAVPVDDILRAASAVHKKWAARFPPPPSRSAKAANSGAAVRVGKTGKKYIQYSKKGITDYNRVDKKFHELFEDIAGMRDSAQYVGAPTLEDAGNVVPIEKKKRRRA